MQSLNISSLHDPEIQVIATKIPEVKYFSIFSINNTLTKLHSILVTHWYAHVVKIIPTILIHLTVIIIVISIVTLYCWCWWNKYSCVPKCTRPQDSPTPSNDLNLTTFLASVHNQPHQVTPQIMWEILKYFDFDLEKIECYKHHKPQDQTTYV